MWNRSLAGWPCKGRKGKESRPIYCAPRHKYRELASFQIWTPPRPPPAVRIWVILLLFGCKFIVVRSGAGHQPFRWTLAHMENSKLICTNTTPGAPTFVVTNCDLLRPRFNVHAAGRVVCRPTGGMLRIC